MWPKNFQMLTLDLENTEEPEIKLPTSIGSQEKWREFQETSTSVSLTTLKSLCGSQKNCGKFWKRWDYQATLPASWETCMHSQEATVRTRHGTTDWLKIGKEVYQGCILSPCLLNSVDCISNKMPGWMTHKLESSLLWEISTTWDMQMILLYGKKRRETKRASWWRWKKRMKKLA